MNRKIIRSVISNAIICITVWFAVQGSEGAGNLVKFIAGITPVLSIVLLFAIAVNAKLGEPNQLLENISHLTDYFSIIVLVWFGWMWCAASFAFGWLACSMVFESRKKNVK